MDTREWFIEHNNLPKTLSKEETYELFEKKKSGDQQAREKIISHNIRLVLYETVTKFKTVNYDKKDIVSVGNIGLIKAVDSFDNSRGIPFVVYAIRCIDNEILMFINKMNKYQNIDNLDRIIYENIEGEQIKLKDSISDNVNVEEEYIKNEIYRILRGVINKLPIREKEIIMMYFGFVDNYIFTQSEISKILNITQSGVSRIISRTLKDIKKRLEVEKIIEMKTSAQKKHKI